MSTSGKLPEEIPASQIRYESGGAIEEIFNSLTHAIGAGLAIAGLVALLILTGKDPSPWKYVGFSIFGASQILLFLSSAVMHGFAAMPRIRRSLAVFDHALIYVLIAGTYTPLCLIAMRGNWGWVILGIIWSLAIIGIVLRTIFFDRTRLLADLLYVPMGWLIVLFFRPLLQTTSVQLVVWAMIAGVFYTVGVVFYAWCKFSFSHVVWHLFVIVAGVSFFVGYALHLV
ncbi:MAG: hemolysin III family protein [Spirochaetia bacterium]